MRADVTAFIAAMRAAARAAREFGDDAERAGERARVGFEIARGGADRLERELRRLMDTQRQQAEQTRRNTEETRRNTEEQQRNQQQNNQNRQSQDRSTRSTAQATRGLTANRESLIAAIAGAVALGAAVTSAGVAFGVFGAVAVPSIIKVVGAQDDLSASWTTLSAQQRVSALQVHALTEEYKALARSYEPQALQAFNTIVSTARGLLPQLAGVMDATSGSVLQFTTRISDFISERIGGEFLSWAGREAPQALDLFGTTMTVAGDTALDVVQDMAPLGIGLLQITNGILSGVNAVAAFNPLLAQLAISALLLRAPVAGVVAGIGAMTGRVRAFNAANATASRSARLLNMATAAGPALFIAAGVGLGFLLIKLASMKTTTDKLVSAQQIQTRAIGNNLSGHESFRRFLESQYLNSLREVQKVQAKLNSEDVKSGQMRREVKGDLEKAGRAADSYREALDKQVQKIDTLNRASDLLANKYGISAEQARRLADAAGVDLSAAMQKNGQLTDSAAKKIDQYRQAVELARDPLRQIKLALNDAGNEALQMKDRLTALTAALDAQFNPSIQAFQATTQLREGFRKLGVQIDAAKGKMDGSSEASLQLRQTFAQQLIQLRDLHAAELQRTGSIAQANAATAKYLPIMYAMAGGNREARAQVDALARTMGFNTAQTHISRSAFMAQAVAMTGSRARAEQLWAAYQRLTGATNTGSTSLGAYIGRVRTAAEAARNQAGKTDFGASRQQVYNSKIRESLPVLYALAGRNAAARAEVDRIARSAGIATGAMNTSKAAFLRTADAMGIGRARAEQLWRELAKLPKGKHIPVTVTAEGTWSRAREVRPELRATGGPITGEYTPGATEAYDSVPALLRVNEHVWTPEEVRAAGGHDAMYRLRAAAKAGRLQGYARGGRVTLTSRQGSVGEVVRPVYTHINDSVALIARAMAAQWKKYAMSGGAALSWARSQAGKPYIWGGVGPAGYDCSGFTSAITNVIQRRNPHQRRHTTHSFGASSGPDGFVRGLRSPYMVGVTDAGVGHMAGTLGGVAVESSGSAGVRVGGGARGADHPMFSRQYGLRMARGGAVTEAARRLAARALRATDRDDVALAASLGLTGDPSSEISPARPAIPGYAGGGWVRGRGGTDKVLLRATAGEFMVTRQRAAEVPGLVEAINAGRVGQAIVAPTIRAAPGAVSGGRGGARGGDGVSLTVVLQNHGWIGSQLQVEDMLAKGLDNLRRQGRLPAQLRG